MPIFINRRRSIWIIESVRRQSWSIARLISAGFGIVTRQYRIEYKQPALMDDELEFPT